MFVNLSTGLDYDDDALLLGDTSLNLTQKVLIWPSRGAWNQINKQVKWWLMFHAYGFAVSFMILAFYSFFSILNIRSLITNRPYMATVNIFLCVLSTSRATLLFIDPYSLKDVMPRLLGIALWDVGLPSLISALALLQLALFQLTQLPIGPKLLKRKSCLSLVIALHFACVLAVDMTLNLHSNIHVMKNVVDSTFYLWGIALGSLFIYTSHKAMTILRNMPSAMLERDIDSQYKGIMQLAMLAPYNNLATSVAAALVPTLLAPKLVRGPTRATAAIAASTSTSNSATSSPLNNKTEMKRCILKSTPKPSPNSSDNEEPKQMIAETELKPPKKLSWGPDRRISANPSKKEQKTATSSTNKLEEETEDGATTSLLPQNKESNDLTLDAILNHIAFMNRGGVTETTQSRKHRLKHVLRLTALTPALVLLLVFANLFKLCAPRGWYSNYAFWLIYETTCRALEVFIAWAMANLTKQPVSNPSHSHGYPPSHHHHKGKQSMFM